MATALKVINSLEDDVVSLIWAMGELFEDLILWRVHARLCRVRRGKSGGAGWT